MTDLLLSDISSVYIYYKAVIEEKYAILKYYGLDVFGLYIYIYIYIVVWGNSD